ncbi:MAG: leucyl aminopeptidase [Acholeplasmataceae bacterium]|nr:leucyl aminopeptidase [Acholeplasmataceae bacterium]
MEIFKSNHYESEKPLVVGAFLDEKVRIAEAVDTEIEAMINEKDVSLCLGKVNKIPTFGKIKNRIIYLIGLGKKDEYDYENLEESLRGVNYLLGNELILDVDSFAGGLDIREAAKRIVKTIGYYNYVYDEFLSKKIDNELTLRLISEVDFDAEIKEAFNLVTAINNTRDLVNKPYNHLSATDLADYAKSLVQSLNSECLSIKVYDKKEIESLGMNAFLAVNKGSEAEPKLIHIKFENAESEAIGLVGKGLMYDTGGYSIKTSMNNMKCDMAGAATVLGVLEAAVKNDLKVNLQIVICATDNRIDGGALLPDDVLTAMNKKTIEIISTDAEGRLTLADGVYFAQKEGCKTVVDIATLTGACVVALGDYTTGLFGNSCGEIEKIIAAAKEANEELWQLPINRWIRDEVRSSKVADLKNSTGRLMGASGAAAFIEEFIEEGTKWLHLDIAGTAFHTSPHFKEYYGATGTPVFSVYQYLKKSQQ